MVEVDAVFIDATHLKLSRPIEAPLGQTVRVTVSIVEDDAERRAWLDASALGLSAAYGPDEPEYSVEMIKTPNPGFVHK